MSQITGAKAETVHKAIQASIDRANKRAESNAKRVAKWTILPKDFSVPGGELGEWEFTNTRNGFIVDISWQSVLLKLESIKKSK